jgi:hypothetical protein
MQKILTNDLWKTALGQARRARRRMAAIAYVTKNLLRFTTQPIARGWWASEIVKTQPDEQRVVDRAIKALRPIMSDPDEEPDWIRWFAQGRFARECQEGDSMIRIWTSHKAKRPSAVIRSAPVLLKRRGATPRGSHSELSWGRFQRLFTKAGGTGRIKPGRVRVLEQDFADILARKWNSAARS